MDITKINAKEIKYYLEAIDGYCTQIEDNPNESANVVRLLDMLKCTGYLMMNGGQLGDVLYDRIPNIAYSIKGNTTLYSPSFINFTTLLIDAQWYKVQWKKHKDFIWDSPTLQEDIAVEEAWEKVSNEMKQMGSALVMSGLDILSVLYARQTIFKEIPFSNGWNRSWAIFYSKACEFINTLTCIDVTCFFQISDQIRERIGGYAKFNKEISKELRDFIRFVRKIGTPDRRQNQASGYRMMIFSEEAREIFFDIDAAYDSKKQELSKIYIYECALAEKAITWFIKKLCLADGAAKKTDISSISNWKLYSSSMDGLSSVLPMIRAGSKTYPVCVIPPRVKGFGLRRDLVKQLGERMDGLLFCSFKTHLSGATLVRFDNFIERARILDILNKLPVAEGTINVTKIPFEEVYKLDNRDKFLKIASMSVMGLESMSSKLTEAIKSVFNAPSKVFDKIIDQIIKIGSPEIMVGILQPSKEMSDTAVTIQKSTYEPISSLEGVKFLDLGSENETISSLTDRMLEESLHYMWFFADQYNDIIDQFNGPEEFDGDPIEIIIPLSAECAYFFIGKEEALNEIKDAYSDGDEIEAKSDWIFYMIIYGPDDNH
jgi:hypothetical protein